MSINWATTDFGAKLLGFSSEVEGCEAQNVLDPNIPSIWLTEEGLPHWICISLADVNNGEETVIRTIGWHCWHPYTTNPSEVVIHVSNDGAKFKIWDTFTSSQVKGTQLFCCTPISTTIYPYIAFEITRTFGGQQTYLNRVYMYSEEIPSSPAILANTPGRGGSLKAANNYHNSTGSKRGDSSSMSSPTINTPHQLEYSRDTVDNDDDSLVNVPARKISESPVRTPKESHRDHSPKQHQIPAVPHHHQLTDVHMPLVSSEESRGDGYNNHDNQVNRLGDDAMTPYYIPAEKQGGHDRDDDTRSRDAQDQRKTQSRDYEEGGDDDSITVKQQQQRRRGGGGGGSEDDVRDADKISHRQTRSSDDDVNDHSSLTEALGLDLSTTSTIQSSSEPFLLSSEDGQHAAFLGADLPPSPSSQAVADVVAAEVEQAVAVAAAATEGEEEDVTGDIAGDHTEQHHDHEHGQQQQQSSQEQHQQDGEEEETVQNPLPLNETSPSSSSGTTSSSTSDGRSSSILSQSRRKFGLQQQHDHSQQQLQQHQYHDNVIADRNKSTIVPDNNIVIVPVSEGGGEVVLNGVMITDDISINGSDNHGVLGNGLDHKSTVDVDAVDVDVEDRNSTGAGTGTAAGGSRRSSSSCSTGGASIISAIKSVSGEEREEGGRRRRTANSQRGGGGGGANITSNKQNSSNSSSSSSSSSSRSSVATASIASTDHTSLASGSRSSKRKEEHRDRDSTQRHRHSPVATVADHRATTTISSGIGPRADDVPLTASAAATSTASGGGGIASSPSSSTATSTAGTSPHRHSRSRHHAATAAATTAAVGGEEGRHGLPVALPITTNSSSSNNSRSRHRSGTSISSQSRSSHSVAANSVSTASATASTTHRDGVAATTANRIGNTTANAKNSTIKSKVAASSYTTTAPNTQNQEDEEESEMTHGTPYPPESKDRSSLPSHPRPPPESKDRSSVPSHPRPRPPALTPLITEYNEEHRRILARAKTFSAALDQSNISSREDIASILSAKSLRRSSIASGGMLGVGMGMTTPLRGGGGTLASSSVDYSSVPGYDDGNGDGEYQQEEEGGGGGGVLDASVDVVAERLVSLEERFSLLLTSLESLSNSTKANAENRKLRTPTPSHRPSSRVFDFAVSAIADGGGINGGINGINSGGAVFPTYAADDSELPQQTDAAASVSTATTRGTATTASTHQRGGMPTSPHEAIDTAAVTSVGAGTVVSSSAIVPGPSPPGVAAAGGDGAGTDARTSNNEKAAVAAATVEDDRVLRAVDSIVEMIRGTLEKVDQRLYPQTQTKEEVDGATLTTDFLTGDATTATIASTPAAAAGGGGAAASGAVASAGNVLQHDQYYTESNYPAAHHTATVSGSTPAPQFFNPRTGGHNATASSYFNRTDGHTAIRTNGHFQSPFSPTSSSSVFAHLLNLPGGGLTTTAASFTTAAAATGGGTGAGGGGVGGGGRLTEDVAVIVHELHKKVLLKIAKEAELRLMKLKLYRSTGDIQMDMLQHLDSQAAAAAAAAPPQHPSYSSSSMSAADLSAALAAVAAPPPPIASAPRSYFLSPTKALPPVAGGGSYSSSKLRSAYVAAAAAAAGEEALQLHQIQHEGDPAYNTTRGTTAGEIVGARSHLSENRHSRHSGEERQRSSNGDDEYKSSSRRSGGRDRELASDLYDDTNRSDRKDRVMRDRSKSRDRLTDNDDNNHNIHDHRNRHSPSSSHRHHHSRTASSDRQHHKEPAGRGGERKEKKDRDRFHNQDHSSSSRPHAPVTQHSSSKAGTTPDSRSGRSRRGERQTTTTNTISSKKTSNSKGRSSSRKMGGDDGQENDGEEERRSPRRIRDDDEERRERHRLRRELERARDELNAAIAVAGGSRFVIELQGVGDVASLDLDYGSSKHSTTTANAVHGSGKVSGSRKHSGDGGARSAYAPYGHTDSSSGRYYDGTAGSGKSRRR